MMNPNTRAFTLLEVMLAMAVSAIVLAGIGGVFFSALRLRERTTALVDESAPFQQALGVMRRDLLGALPPGTVLAGNFINQAGGGVGGGASLQFCTTTGALKGGAPWGDIQQVIYGLRDPSERTANGSKELIRSVTRNLLATAETNIDDQLLLTNVQQVAFSCYDGFSWRDSWDTSMGDTNLPVAVRVTIQLATENRGSRDGQTLEMVVPFEVQSRTNTAQSTQ